jgi:hypothetical protein
MLPHKHYAAPEIEEVLQKQDDPTKPPHECSAEESTLYRWKVEFPEKLNSLAAILESLANTSKIYLSSISPLQRVYNALDNAIKAFNIPIRSPPDFCRLAWAFFVSQAHPVCLG